MHVSYACLLAWESVLVSIQRCSQIKRLSSATQQGASSSLLSCLTSQEAGYLSLDIPYSVMFSELDLIHELLSMLNPSPPKISQILSDSAPVIPDICFSSCLHAEFIKPALSSCIFKPPLLGSRCISYFYQLPFHFCEVQLGVHRALQWLKKKKNKRRRVKSIFYLSRQL